MIFEAHTTCLLSVPVVSIVHQPHLADDDLIIEKNEVLAGVPGKRGPSAPWHHRFLPTPQLCTESICSVLTSSFRMLLSAFVKLSRCSKQLIVPEGAHEILSARSLASAAEGKGAPRWYKDVKVVPGNAEVGEQS